jgi:uncharacterized membrane protein YraQ (UPF0718 family)
VTESLALLLISLAVLGVAPFVVPLLQRDPRWVQGLDGFVLAAIGALVGLHLVPHAIEDAGPVALGTFLLGLLVPLVLERVGHVRARHAHAFALGLGLLGLLGHAVVDGVAIAGSAGIDLSAHAHHHGHAHGHGHNHDHSSMGLGVVLHRLPVAIALWWLVRPRYGRVAGWAVLGLTGVATIVGFMVGNDWMASASLEALGLFQGFVSGMLLHVMFHRHEHGDGEHGGTGGCCDVPARPGARWSESLGALLGLVTIVGVPLALGTEAVDPSVHAWAHRLLDLSLESAPALLLGFMLAGLGGVFLPRASLGWLGHGSSLSQSARGMVFGLPLPICSCGVVPMYRTLVQRGAPPSAAMAFLIATPELGIEALILSVPFLGWELTWTRLACAAGVAWIAGWFVGKQLGTRAPLARAAAPAAGIRVPSMGPIALGAPPTIARIASTEAPAPATTPMTTGARWREGLRHGFVETVDDIAIWLVVGLAVAAFFDPSEATAWAELVPPSLEVVAFALLGLPIYVCASGATPLAAAMLLAGVSPGAALAFLLAGPATNVTTFGVLTQLHGKAAALRFGATVFGLSVVAGLIVNALPIASTGALGTGDAHGHGLLGWSALTLLGLVFVASVVRQGPRAFLAGIFALGIDTGHSHDHDHKDDDCCAPPHTP